MCIYIYVYGSSSIYIGAFDPVDKYFAQVTGASEPELGRRNFGMLAFNASAKAPGVIMLLKGLVVHIYTILGFYVPFGPQGCC